MLKGHIRECSRDSVKGVTLYSTHLNLVMQSIAGVHHNTQETGQTAPLDGGGTPFFCLGLRLLTAALLAVGVSQPRAAAARALRCASPLACRRHLPDSAETDDFSVPRHQRADGSAVATRTSWYVTVVHP